MITHDRRLSLLLCVIIIAGLGCGGPHTGTRSGADTMPVIALGVADEGDLEGTIEAFEHRIASMPPTHEKYPMTLERLALAYVEHVDALTVDAAATSDTAEQQALLARAEEQQKRAITHFEALVEGFPTYEGTPASLLMLVYAYEAEGRADDKAAALQRLIEGYSGTELAFDALVLRADDLFAAHDHAGAEQLYAQVEAADPPSARAAYAVHRRAWCRYRQGDAGTAFDLLRELMDHPRLDDAGLADAARRDLVLFYASTDAPDAQAADMITPFARDEAEREAMLQLFQAVRSKPRED